jgi:hypothetical protein
MCVLGHCIISAERLVLAPISLYALNSMLMWAHEILFIILSMQLQWPRAGMRVCPMGITPAHGEKQSVYNGIHIGGSFAKLYDMASNSSPWWLKSNIPWCL